MLDVTITCYCLQDFSDLDEDTTTGYQAGTKHNQGLKHTHQAHFSASYGCTAVHVQPASFHYSPRVFASGSMIWYISLMLFVSNKFLQFNCMPCIATPQMSSNSFQWSVTLFHPPPL